MHVKAEGFGKPLAFVITEGQRHESRAFEELMKLGKLKRDSAGRPRLKPRCLAADKAYSQQPPHPRLAKEEEDTSGYTPR